MVTLLLRSSFVHISGVLVVSYVWSIVSLAATLINSLLLLLLLVLLLLLLLLCAERVRLGEVLLKETRIPW